MFFISAIWSPLAVVARRDLKQGPLGYGILNGSLGVGAAIAATGCIGAGAIFGGSDSCSSDAVQLQCC